MSKKNFIVLSLSILTLLGACTPEPVQQGIKIGKPYEVSGHVYAPAYNPGYDETGIASWYGPGFHGGRTASGERYDQNDFTAAHKTLPLPSMVRVTNLNNGRSIIVRINDRGPFVNNRIIDLSRAAAYQLGMMKRGTARVRVQYLDKETREYVSNLPNGRESLKRLDMLAQSNKSGTGKSDQIAVSELGTIADDEPLPFVAPTYAPRPVSGNIIKPVAYVTPVTQAKPISDAPKYTDAQTVTAGSYFIQAGTFGVRGNAERMLTILHEMGQAKVVESMHGGKIFYCVLAGPYRSHQDAENILSKLDTVGISGAKIVRD